LYKKDKKNEKMNSKKKKKRKRKRKQETLIKKGTNSMIQNNQNYKVK